MTGQILIITERLNRIPISVKQVHGKSNTDKKTPCYHRWDGIAFEQSQSLEIKQKKLQEHYDP